MAHLVKVHSRGTDMRADLKKVAHQLHKKLRHKLYASLTLNAVLIISVIIHYLNK